MVGSLFGDSIDWRASLFLKGTKDNVKYLGVWRGYVYFEDLDGNSDKLECKKVLQIIDSQGNKINYDCEEPSYYPDRVSTLEFEVEQQVKKNNSGSIGGALIALGAGMITTQLIKDYDDFEDYKSVRTINTIGFILIGVGGLLIAIGM